MGIYISISDEKYSERQNRNNLQVIKCNMARGFKRNKSAGWRGARGIGIAFHLVVTVTPGRDGFFV